MWKSRRIRKLIRKLRWKRIDLLLYENNFTHIPNVAPRMGNVVVQRARKPQKTGIAKLDRKLNDSNYCYYVSNGKDLLHQNWIFYKSRLLRQFGFLELPLLGDGFTVEELRGKGIQPFVITAMLRDLLEEGYKGAFTLVSPGNASSIRGVEKAGFVLRAHIKSQRFLGICFRKTIE